MNDSMERRTMSDSMGDKLYAYQAQHIMGGGVGGGGVGNSRAAQHCTLPALVSVSDAARNGAHEIEHRLTGLLAHLRGKDVPQTLGGLGGEKYGSALDAMGAGVLADASRNIVATTHAQQRSVGALAELEALLGVGG